MLDRCKFEIVKYSLFLSEISYEIYCKSEKFFV